MINRDALAFSLDALADNAERLPADLALTAALGAGIVVYVGVAVVSSLYLRPKAAIARRLSRAVSRKGRVAR
jgi:sensor c-di-GMP phosphodiesterase-like protein